MRSEELRWMWNRRTFLERSSTGVGLAALSSLLAESSVPNGFSLDFYGDKLVTVGLTDSVAGLTSRWQLVQQENTQSTYAGLSLGYQLSSNVRIGGVATNRAVPVVTVVVNTATWYASGVPSRGASHEIRGRVDARWAELGLPATPSGDSVQNATRRGVRRRWSSRR